MAKRNQSKFVTDGVADDPLVQGSKFEMDADDRQFIDNQIRGIQQHIIDNPPGASSDTATNVGTGAAIFQGKVAGTFNLRKLKAGSNTTITENADDITISSTGSGSVSVTPLGAAPLAVVKDVSGSAVRHRTIRVAGNKSGEQDPAGFAGEIHIRPTPPGWFNPMDYGCFFDGIRDDLPGLNAMMADIAATVPGLGPAIVHLPPNKGYCSDNLRIKHGVTLRGHGGSALDALHGTGTGIEFPPLKGVILESVYTVDDYPVSPGADSARIEGVSFVSRQAIVTRDVLNHGVAMRMLDPDVDLRAPSTFYEKGRCVIAAGYAGGAADSDAYAEGATREGPTVMFRVTTAGTSSGGSAPAAFATDTVANIGATHADGSVVWTTESIPKDYKTNHAYVVGERVFLPGDTQAYFECITAGTSLVAGALNGSANGIGVTCPSRMLSPVYGEKFYEVGSSGLRWEVHFPSGANVLAPSCTIEDCTFTGFTGYGVFANSALDSAVYASTFGFADFTNVSHTFVAFCGGGLRFNGSDGGGGHTFNCNFMNLGMGRTNVDAAAYLNIGGDLWGTGAAGILDRSVVGNHHLKHYLQFSSGCPWRNDTFGGGSPTSFVRCIAETAQKAFFRFGAIVMGCTPLPTVGDGLIIDTAIGRGLREVDARGADVVNVALSNTGGGVFGFHTTTDLGNEWGWRFDNGYWRLAYSGQNAQDAFYVTSFGTGFAPGSSFFGTERGYFLGDRATAKFRGALDNTNSSTGITDRYLRSGFRRKGDVFEGAKSSVTVTTDGYRGVPWSAGATTYGGYLPESIPPTIIEPTANGPTPMAGLSVWKMTPSDTPGLTHATTEPVWSSATPSGGTAVGDTITDNTSTWVLIGFTPETICTYADTVATTDATPVYVTLATLNVHAVRQIDVVASVKKADGTVRQSFKLSANVYGAAGPTATLDGGSLTDASPHGTGTADVRLDISSGGLVRLKITGIAATNLTTTYDASVV